MKYPIILVVFLSIFSFNTNAQQVLPMRERARVIDEILEERFELLLPQLMDANGIDMWLLIAREYNEDPVVRTMLPANWLNARRRTILLFYRDRKSNTIEKLAIARYNVGTAIKSAWDKEKEPDQMKRLVEVIEEFNPEKIGLNYSKDFNIGDGIVKTDYELLMSYLPSKYQKRIVSAEKLSTAWIETRTAREMEIYQQLVAITHQIIEEAFSEKVITPGVTTTTDVEWFLRQKVNDLGLKTWFHPTVDIQRSSSKLVSHIESFSNRPDDLLIREGDLLHCDFGITYLRLNTDCQEMAYVRRSDETQIPAYLTEAFASGNKVQDALIANMKKGKTGNEILKASLEQAKSTGLRPSIYTHPLGSYGHSSGTTIGMWDSQGGVEKADGYYPLNYNTVYAIELNNTIYVEEWKTDVRIMLEEAGFFGEDGFRYVGGRQTEMYIIPRLSSHLGN